MSLLVLSDSDIRTVLSPRRAIDSQRAAYLAAAEGRLSASGVTSAHDPADDSLTFAHTGAIAGLTGVTCKFGMQVSGNAARGLPSVHAIVTVLRPDTGEPVACLNGTTVTALRTAAGVAAAAEVLARSDAGRLGLIGAGVQARETARLIAEVRDLSAIRIHGLRHQQSSELAADLQAELGVPSCPVMSAEEAAANSDILVTATTSREPVVCGEWLPAGSTVLTIGSYEQDRRELDLGVTARADLIVADDPVKASSQCGILVEARQQEMPVQVAAIGDVIAGRSPGRRAATDVALFLCTGLGVQDASLAWAIIELAVARKLGTTVEF